MPIYQFDQLWSACSHTHANARIQWSNPIIVQLRFDMLLNLSAAILKKYTNKIWSTGNANFGTIKQTRIPTEYVAQNSRKLIKGRGPEEKKKYLTRLKTTSLLIRGKKSGQEFPTPHVNVLWSISLVFWACWSVSKVSLAFRLHLECGYC